MFDDLSHLATINVTSTYLRRKKTEKKSNKNTTDLKSRISSTPTGFQ